MVYNQEEIEIYKPAVSSQILWSASMVNIKYHRTGKIGCVEEIEIKFGFWNWREDTAGWTGPDLADSNGEILCGYLSLSLSIRSGDFHYCRAISVVRSSEK